MVLYTLVAFLLFSCKGGVNDLTKTKTVNDVVYNLSFCPREMMTSDTSIEAADLFYYRFVISETDKQAKRISELYLQSNYNKLLFYINQNIQGDFKTFINNKEQNPVQVYFESNNRITQKLVFLLAFEKPIEQDGDLTVEFNDNIFNNGKIKFKYDLKELI